LKHLVCYQELVSLLAKSGLLLTTKLSLSDLIFGSKSWSKENLLPYVIDFGGCKLFRFQLNHSKATNGIEGPSQADQADGASFLGKFGHYFPPVYFIENIVSVQLK
jgi:hypothetical protein